MSPWTELSDRKLLFICLYLFRIRIERLPLRLVSTKLHNLLDLVFQYIYIYIYIYIYGKILKKQEQIWKKNTISWCIASRAASRGIVDFMKFRVWPFWGQIRNLREISCRTVQKLGHFDVTSSSYDIYIYIYIFTGSKFAPKNKKWCQIDKKWPHQQRGALWAPLLPAIFCQFGTIFYFAPLFANLCSIYIYIYITKLSK